MKHVRDISRAVPYRGQPLTAETATAPTPEAVAEAQKAIGTRLASVEKDVSSVPALVKAATDKVSEMETAMNTMRTAHEQAIRDGNTETANNIKASMTEKFDEISTKLADLEKLATARAAAADRAAAGGHGGGEETGASPIERASSFLNFTRDVSRGDDAFGSAYAAATANAEQLAAFEEFSPRFFRAMASADRHNWASFQSDIARNPVASALFSPSQVQLTQSEIRAITKSAARLARIDTSGMSPENIVQRAGLFSPSVTAPEYQVPEMFKEMLRCFDNPTDVLGMINVRYTKKRRYRQWIEVPDEGFGTWECEQKCQPDPADALPLPEPKDGQVYGVSTHMCIHIDELDDMDRDWAAFIVNGLMNRMRKTLAYAVLWGEGNGMPQGLVKNVTQFDLGDTPGLELPAGAFINWEAIEAGSTLLSDEALNAPDLAVLGNRAGYVQLATTRNSLGDRSNLIRFGANGEMWIGSYRYKALSWLPKNANTHKSANPLQAQAVNFLLGSMKRAYTLVVRKEAGISRHDPVNGGTCATFLARARADGYVNCANEMVAFKSP